MIVSFFLVKEKVYAGVFYINNEQPEGLNTASNLYVENFTGSGTIRYISFYGNNYTPDGDDDFQWQIRDQGGSYVDCQTEVKKPSELGFYEFSDIAEFDNMNFVNQVILEFTGTECTQTYTNFTGNIFTSPVAGGQRSLYDGGGSGKMTNVQITSDLESIVLANETEFFNLNPSNGETRATSTSNTLYADLYLLEKDYVADSYIKLSYVRQQDLQSAIANQDLLWTTFELNDIITSGYNFVATSTGDLGLYGVYIFKAELRKPNSWWSTALSWFNPFTSTDPDIITSTSTTFTYGQMTTFDQYVASTTEYFGDFIASSTTSMEQVQESCNPISGFDLMTCISGLFIPSKGDITNAINTFKENIATRFPLGYLNDFISIISTSTIGTMTVLDAEMPEALGLGKSTIRLDLTGVLDPYLNATTSQFSNSMV